MPKLNVGASKGGAKGEGKVVPKAEKAGTAKVGTKVEYSGAA